ncbi:hypothetical protein EDD29_0164 [Actinocorallia herbida]|uniref:Uncharacterized protein n=2 Tax=Actinocorallia herbida TaxID=58109 RepID=A0A3N1CMZ9_9ACTN|nr:hypothetical protein EDD29_0164 [Actinocorallia herbida]
MFAVDAVSFSRHRDPEVHRELRDAMYSIVRTACEETGLPWPECHVEDRGDGILVIAPEDTDVEAVIDDLADALRRMLGAYNHVLADPFRLRLRMAVSDGYVHLDGHGVIGGAVIHMFRLLDAPSFKREIGDRPGDLSLIVAAHLYEDVVQYATRLDPASFRPVTVSLKETFCHAWIRLSARSASAAPDFAEPTAEDAAKDLLLLLGRSIAEGALRRDPEPDGLRSALTAAIDQLLKLG